MRKFLSTIVVVLSMALLLAATAFLVRFLDRTLAERMTGLKNRTVETLENLVGRRISYESVSPSILQYIEVRNLSIHGSDESKKPLFTVSSMRISYSLIRLLFNPDPAAALREIRIENSVVTFDADTDKDIPRLLETFASSGGEGTGQPIRFSGANVELRLSSGERTFTLSKLFFTVDSKADYLAVDFRAEAEGYITAGIDFKTSFAVQGKLGRKLDWSDLTLRILSFSSSIASVGSQTFQLVWREGSLEVRRIQDSSPMDIQLAADLEKEQYTLKIRADGFKPEGIIRFNGALAAYNVWLSAPFTASGSLTYSGPKKLLEYQGELSAVLSGQLPIHDVRAHAKLRGSEKSVVFETVSLSSSESRLEFSGDVAFPSLYPRGTLVLDNFSAVGAGNVDARIFAERRDGRLEVRADFLEIGGIPFDFFTASLRAEASGGQRFRIAASLAGTSHSNVMEAEGVLKLGRKPSLTTAVELTRVPAAPFLLLASGGSDASGLRRDAAAVLSPFLLSAELSLETDFSAYSLASRSISLVSREEPGTEVAFSLFADEKSLAVSDFIGLNQETRIKGDFRSRRSAGGDLEFTSSVTFGEVPFSFSGSYSKTGLELKGSYGFALALAPGSHGEYTLQAKAERLPIPAAAGSQSISFALEGDFPVNGQWRVTCPSLLIYDLPMLGSGTNTAYLSLALTEKEIRISRMKYIDDASVLEGQGSISYSLRTESPNIGLFEGLSAEINAELASASSESYTVHGKVGGGSTDITVGFKALPLTRLGSFALAGELTGSVRLSGPLSALSAEIDAELRKGRLGTDPIVMAGRLSVSGDRLDVKSLSVKYLSHSLSGSSGVIRIDEGTYDLRTRYLGEFFGDTAASEMHLAGKASSSDMEGLISGFLDSDVHGTLSLSNTTVNAKAVPSWNLNFRTSDSILYFDGGPFDALHGSIDSKNAFVLLLQSPLPIVGTAEGRIIGDRIESTLKLKEADMRVLNAVLKSPVITITSGVLSGELAISGPINDPDYTGRGVRLENGSMACVYAVDAVGPFSTTLSFSGKTFSFPTVSTTAGMTRVSASGTFTLDHWVPVAFIVNIRTEGETVAHVKGRFGSVRMDGYASGAVRISGNERKTEFSGSLLASECQITLGPNIDGKFVPEEPPTLVTLSVQTGKRVEFQWPSTEYPLVRAMAKPGNSLAITYRGDTGGYTVKGTTEIQGGDVFYFDRSFVMKSGKIIFDETQTDFDPRITVRAEVRERDPQTNTPVKIYLDAEGKLSLFSPRFSSDPPRSDVEIMAMIGAPILDRTENQRLLEGTAMLVLDPLSQFLILRPFEQKVRTLLGIDSFSLRTQIIPNFLAQKAFGAEINPLDNTSLSLGKYIGNDLFGEIMVSLHSQENASGIPNINLSWEFNLEWATPLFLLNWNFAPRTPQSLFLPDNSISLNWRFSY